MRIDADTFTVVATQALAIQPSDISVSQDGTKVCVAEDGPASPSHMIPILDGTTLAPVGEIPDVLPMSLVSAN